NPSPAPFVDADAGIAGTLHDAETGTLIPPPASGQATAIALSLTDGAALSAVQAGAAASSPALAFKGPLYGDQRTGHGTEETQIVLHARTVDVVEEDVATRVEAVTDTGYAILVQDRQRFVHGPPPGQEEEPSQEPEDEASEGESSEEN